ncbi:MAG: efflux RND transporter periplasmic adaptor subunit [Flavobacteriales bacterium]|nr:efflux RND transporter periplasmic adaptor subunit [Flavobacteriales bacterium]
MKTIIFLVALGFLYSCGSAEESSPADEKVAMNTTVTLTDAQYKTAQISYHKLETKSISGTVKLNGKIDVPPQNLISVSVPLGGYLKSTKLLPGMRLTKGEVIAVLEDQQYIQLQEDFLITKSKLEFAEQEFERQKELNKSKSTSDKAFQQAKSEFQNLRISVQSLAEKLKLININPRTLSENNISRSISLTAPFNGFVSKVNVNIGKYVNPTDVLFELVDPTDIHLTLKVFEKDLVKLSIGQKLFAYSNSDSEKKFECEILLISQDVSADGSAEVHCHFAKYDKNLIPGMYMNAEIELKSNQVLAVEEEAIVSFEGKNYLFLKQGKQTFEMLQVELGVKENGWVEVLNSSIFEGKEIVSKGAYTLLMSLKNKAEE